VTYVVNASERSGFSAWDQRRRPPPAPAGKPSSRGTSRCASATAAPATSWAAPRPASGSDNPHILTLPFVSPCHRQRARPEPAGPRSGYHGQGPLATRSVISAGCAPPVPPAEAKAPAVLGKTRANPERRARAS
jgi:hypothetical protein